MSFRHLFFRVHNLVRHDCQHSACCCWWIDCVLFRCIFWEYLEFQSPSSNMACFLPLRKTKNVQSHMKKFVPGSVFQGPKFRITKAFHKWHGVLMCFVSFASQVCPNRKPEKAEATKIGINGFGRIGRMVFQAELSQQIGFPPLVIPGLYSLHVGWWNSFSSF